MSNFADWIKKDLEDLKDDKAFVTQSLLLQVNESICELMDERGLSQSDLAKKLGWSRGAVSKMLRGQHNISIGRLVGVALALGCTLTAPRFIPLDDTYTLRVETGTTSQGVGILESEGDLLGSETETTTIFAGVSELKSGLI